MFARLIVVLTIVLWAGVGLSQTAGGPTTAAAQSEQQVTQASGAFRVEAVICSRIVDRMPVDTVREFASVPVDAYLWLRVLGAADTTAMTVTWFCNGTEILSTTLPVRSSNWRTWAWKTIRSGQSGDWEARVLGPDREVVKAISFKVK